MPYQVLVVDDEALNLEAIRLLLVKEGYHVVTASSGDEAIKKVSANPTSFGVIILDFRMEGKNGAETAREILNITSKAFVLIHSGDDSREAVQSSWEAGALKFIEKSRGAEYFLEQVNHWCRRYESEVLPTVHLNSASENEALIKSIGMVGQSASLANIARRIQKYQEEQTDLNVLILGENGSGKELIARAIHNFSPRNRFPFFAIDAGAMPENLVESELFGHERGAFTGADSKRIGAFQYADRGTLFLDEIGNTSVSVQAKLLRAVQFKSIRPVGTNREIPVNVRIVAATNMDLKRAILEGKFRDDFFYRLKGITIAIPPLRERPEDIEPLILNVCAKYNANRKVKKEFSARAICELEKYSWPGNVRELENLVMQVLTESYADKITPAQLGDAVPKGAEESPTSRNSSLKVYIDEITRQYVTSVMKTSRSKFEAATKSGMAESTFRDLLKRLDLQDLEPGPSKE
jgi:DNA-binding NtrC family response regulator